jgi:hypothetical protein
LNKDVCGGMADPPIRNRFSCLAGGSLPCFFRFRLFRVSLLLLLLFLDLLEVFRHNNFVHGLATL